VHVGFSHGVFPVQELPQTRPGEGRAYQARLPPRRADDLFWRGLPS